MYSVVLMVALSGGADSVDFHHRCHSCHAPACCAPVSTCCAPAPVCYTPVSTCCAPVSCGSACGGRRHGLFGRHRHGCCAPACCAPVSTCCAVADCPTCVPGAPVMAPGAAPKAMPAPAPAPAKTTQYDVPTSPVAP